MGRSPGARPIPGTSPPSSPPSGDRSSRPGDGHPSAGDEETGSHDQHPQLRPACHADTGGEVIFGVDTHADANVAAVLTAVGEGTGSYERATNRAKSGDSLNARKRAPPSAADEELAAGEGQTRRDGARAMARPWGTARRRWPSADFAGSACRTGHPAACLRLVSPAALARGSSPTRARSRPPAPSQARHR